MKTLAAGTMILAALVGKAEFSINLELADKPMRDVRTSTCGPMIGYAGCLNDSEDAPSAYWYVTNRYETSRAMRESGAWFQRMWNANRWFAHRGANPYDPNATNAWELNMFRQFRQTNPE